MNKVLFFVQNTITYKIIKMLLRQAAGFLETLGTISYRLLQILKYTAVLNINFRQYIEQSSRFISASLPVTLSIAAMTAVILCMQITPELVKQGGKDFIGLITSISMVREIGVIMSGFAVISTAGSAQAGELAVMRVTEQIDAMTSLKVPPFQYLFLPRVLAGASMMPLITILASALGILAGGAAAMAAGKDVTWLCYIYSARQGLYIRDINIMLLKSACFGGIISLISSSCGYEASGGAKGAGLAVAKAVVMSFAAIVIMDCIFAAVFYF